MSAHLPDLERGYPLRWPDGRPRSVDRKPALFRDAGRRMTLTTSTGRLLRETGALTRAGKPWRTTSLLLSTNIRFTQSGARDQNVSRGDPEDPGAAFYFDLDRRAHVLACDRWDTVADNIAAIAAHIEALRGQERWGVADLRQAFAGHVALPAPADGRPHQWWRVLGFDGPVASRPDIDAAYRRLATQYHPDAGGTREQWDELVAAYKEARGERS